MNLSLREAVASINTASVVDAILPTSGTFGLDDQIQFDPELFSVGGATILLWGGELNVMAPMQILGPGAEMLWIRAIGFSRIFRIDDLNPSVASPVVVSGLTLAGGNSSSEGGAIWALEPLTIRDSSLIHNTAASGGGVYWQSQSGDFVIERVEIARNLATNGAGIVSFGGPLSNLRIIESTIADNVAMGSENDIELGGGIFGIGGAGLVSGSTITDNISSGYGGGIEWLSSDRLSVVGSTITGNTSATTGGGIDSCGVGELQITGSRISNNEAGSKGGGIAVSCGGVFRIEDSWIDNNVASHGGGLSVTHSFAVESNAFK